MGGDCIGSDLVRLSTGYDFVKMVIEVASGDRPSLTRVSAPSNAAIRFVFAQEDIDILEKIKKSKPEAIRFVSELQPVGDHKIVDSGTRLGFYIATADSYGELIELLELSE